MSLDETRAIRNQRSGEFAQIVTPVQPRLDWVQELRDLASWADDKLNTDYCDRQMIAEHMNDTIQRILLGVAPLDRPF